jgi:hypothetical protein
LEEEDLERVGERDLHSLWRERSEGFRLGFRGCRWVWLRLLTVSGESFSNIELLPIDRNEMLPNKATSRRVFT